MKKTVGRFAPTPSGRMHVGNMLCAAIAYASAKSQGGDFLLRIEDIDTSRCRLRDDGLDTDEVKYIKEDLEWAGLLWDNNCTPDTYQSQRSEIYREHFERLDAQGILYPCTCSRAELHSASAPHAEDGSVLYDGKCRRLFDAGIRPQTDRYALRLRVPDKTVSFFDLNLGKYEEYLPRDCTDFIVRRSDGVFPYQLAVVVDDALSGVTEIVRGRDLLSSTPKQILLYELLGYDAPDFLHIPLLLSPDGKRLSKRDRDIDMGKVRQSFTPEQFIGMLAYISGIIAEPDAISAREFSDIFSREKLKKQDICLPESFFS